MIIVDPPLFPLADCLPNQGAGQLQLCLSGNGRRKGCPRRVLCSLVENAHHQHIICRVLYMLNVHICSAYHDQVWPLQEAGPHLGRAGRALQGRRQHRHRQDRHDC